MELDEILNILGEFGKYQKRLYFLICIPATTCGMVMVLSTLLLGIPDYRCKIPGISNDTFHSQDLLLIQHYIPPPDDDTRKYDGCHLYSYNDTTVVFDNSSRPINASRVECTEWVYDDSTFIETFLSKHNIICRDEIKGSMAKTIFFVGVFAGGIVLGYVSDWFGRKKALYLSFVLMMGSTFGVAFASNYAAFVSLRFLVGAAASGISITGFVIVIELVGKSKRVFAGVVINYFFATGIIILAGVGKLLKRWDYIEIVTACPTVLYLSYWWLVPESPRWLMSKGRYEEAEAILRKAAMVNKVTLPEKLLNRHAQQKTENVTQLFRSRVLCTRTLIILVNCLVIAMTYYGLSLNTGNLGDGFYLNFFISGLVEFPAYLLTLLFLNRLGRKVLHSSSMLLGGIACLCTIFTTIYGGDDLQAVTTTLAMIGKLGSSAAFAIIYIYSSELYPTTVRNVALALTAGAGRIGAMGAPQIADMTKRVGGSIGKTVPLIIFGAASVTAGLLALLLPETLNQRLPETIEDGKLYGTEAYQQRKDEAFKNKGFEEEITDTKL